MQDITDNVRNISHLCIFLLFNVKKSVIYILDVKE